MSILDALDPTHQTTTTPTPKPKQKKKQQPPHLSATPQEPQTNPKTTPPTSQQTQTTGETEKDLPVTQGWLRHVRKHGWDLVRMGQIPPAGVQPRALSEVTSTPQSTRTPAVPDPYTRSEVLRDLETALRQDNSLAPADRLKYLDRVAQLRGFDQPEPAGDHVDPAQLADHLRRVLGVTDPQQVVSPCPLCGK